LAEGMAVAASSLKCALTGESVAAVENQPLSQEYRSQTHYSMKKALREMQTLHAGCSKVEPKIFALAADPLPRGASSHHLISWRWSLPLPANPVWRGSMHAISSYRGNRPTHMLPACPPVANTQTHRQD